MAVDLLLENFRFVDADGRDYSDLVFDEDKARWPDFLIAGMEKCATTWLMFALDEHPEIFILPDESHYFDENFHIAEILYTRMFSLAGEGQLAGEKTPNYLPWSEYPHTLDNILSRVPGIKFLISLRNPVDRLVSAARTHHRVGNLQLDLEDFDGNFVRDGKAVEIERFGISELCHFSPILERLWERVERAGTHVLIFEEDIAGDPVRGLAGVFRFLGVSADFVPATAHHPRFVNADVPHKIDPETRRVLLEHFRPERERVFELLGRTIPSWEA